MTKDFIQEELEKEIEENTEKIVEQIVDRYFHPLCDDELLTQSEFALMIARKFRKIGHQDTKQAMIKVIEKMIDKVLEQKDIPKGFMKNADQMQDFVKELKQKLGELK